MLAILNFQSRQKINICTGPSHKCSYTVWVQLNSVFERKKILYIPIWQPYFKFIISEICFLILKQKSLIKPSSMMDYLRFLINKIMSLFREHIRNFPTMEQFHHTCSLRDFLNSSQSHVETKLSITAMLNFWMKQKSFKTFWSTQVTFMPKKVRFILRIGSWEINWNVISLLMTDDEDRSKVITIPHMIHWVRWVIKSSLSIFIFI